MLSLSIFASGSAANSAVIRSKDTCLLLDAGLNRTQLYERMAQCGLQPRHLKGILVSHEHQDHSEHAAAISSELQIPIYATEGTASAMDWKRCFGGARGLATVSLFKAGSRFSIRDLEISALPLPHDAADPVGFSFRSNGSAAAVITDLGEIPGYFSDVMMYVDLLMLEANHDLGMLKAAPYSSAIKKRVIGPKGHLSNEQTFAFLEKLTPRTKHVILAHVSQSNNHPEILELMAKRILAPKDVGFTIATQDGVLSFEV